MIIVMIKITKIKNIKEDNLKLYIIVCMINTITKIKYKIFVVVVKKKRCLES